MTLKSVSLGLVLCALLFAAAPPVVSQTAPSPVTALTTSSTAPLAGDVAVLWLSVVKDGRTEMRPVTNAELEGTPSITVDGYVNGVVLLSTASMRLAIDGKPTHPIRKNADGSYKVKYFGYLDNNEFWSTFHTEELDRKAMDKIRSCYSSFPKIPGDALSDAQELRITVVGKNVEDALTIQQNPARKLDVCPAPSAVDDQPLEFLYHGSDSRPFEQDDADFSPRAQAILEGIQAAEAFAGSRLVERVHLIDFDGQHNAYTCSGESDIWFYSRLFWKESVDELRTIAAHEAMHILSDRLKLPRNPKIRGLYADLMGFGTLSRERFAVMAAGRPPASRALKGRDASMLFAFINESNFIRGMKGGHAKDDVDELCASFLHTLMYLDRLEPMIEEPILHKDGSFTSLSAEERNELLEDYQTVLAAIADEMPRRRFKLLSEVFQAGLDAADMLALSLEARR